MPPDQRVVKVLYPQKAQHKLCGVSILFKLLMPNEPSEVNFLRLMPGNEGCHWALSVVSTKDAWKEERTPTTATGTVSVNDVHFQESIAA